jgi:hypothetical protein
MLSPFSANQITCGKQNTLVLDHNTLRNIISISLLYKVMTYCHSHVTHVISSNLPCHMQKINKTEQVQDVILIRLAIIHLKILTKL